MLSPKHHRNCSRWCFLSPPQRLRGACRGRCRAQLFATKERYRCGLPLAGTHRPDSAILHRTIVYGCRGGTLPARFLFAPPFFSFSFLRKKRTAAASEEASCIALPPGRRKLHIRWLLLPFRKPTAALGRLSVTIRKEREPSKPEVQTVPPSCNSSVVRPYLPAPNHPTRSDYAPHAILMMAGRRLLTNIATSELRCMK